MNLNSRSFTVSCLALVLTGIFGWVSVTASNAQEYDFGAFSGEQEDRQVKDLLQLKETLWEGRAEFLQFETGILMDRLLTVSATNRRLYVSLGQSMNLLEGDMQRRVPGKILLLDAHSLRNRPKDALVSVTFLSGDQLKSTVYVIQVRDRRLGLRTFHEAQWKLIRPVQGRMMSQQYDLQSVWNNSISFLSTQRSGYRKAGDATLPDGARVMSLAKLDRQRWVFIDGSGKLVISNGSKILDSLDGNFGATPHTLKPVQKNWRRSDQSEPVRFAPEVLPGRNMVALIENPPAPSGLMGYFSGGKRPSSIKLLSTANNRLGLTNSIGPFNGSVFDLEVPPANPDQLLWLRRSGRGRVVLEMLDLKNL